MVGRVQKVPTDEQIAATVLGRALGRPIRTIAKELNISVWYVGSIIRGEDFPTLLAAKKAELTRLLGGLL